MPRFLTLDDLDFAGKTVLLRADLNVPMDHGKVSDATRIERLAPTILELIAKGARVVVMSHFGRPKGVDPAWSLRPVVPALARALGGLPVAFAEDCIGSAARRTIAALAPDGVAVLENVRFHAGEEANDPAFAVALAALGDIYVNDAFSAAHRAHASTAGIARLLPAAAGRLMQAELDALASVLERPARPVMAIVGGAKVSTKLELLGFVRDRVDVLVIGGAMANTLLRAEGVAVGISLVEPDMAETARAFLADTRARGAALLLPIDAVVAKRLASDEPAYVAPIDRVPADHMILDLGARSVAAIAARLADCRTLLWNGPLGAFETPPFDAGTTALARRVAALTDAGRLTSVAGGGDTVAALVRAGVADRLSYVSTAGGAFLELLEGRELPGLAALAEAAAR